VTRFTPYLEYAHLSPTPIPTLERAARIGHYAGLRFVYLGNVPGHEGENTVCPSCKRLLVRRTGDAVEDVALRGTLCAMCGENVNVRTTLK
jgi:pyruvate formate lyase activating enzyme